MRDAQNQEILMTIQAHDAAGRLVGLMERYNLFAQIGAQDCWGQDEHRPCEAEQFVVAALMAYYDR